MRTPVADSDYQLGTPGMKTSPDTGVGHGVGHANLRNGDVYSKQDNRDVERERYIGRQVSSHTFLYRSDFSFISQFTHQLSLRNIVSVLGLLPV